MKKSLVITDLTRMQRRTVCIAGYDGDGNCIRPVLPPPGISERSIKTGDRAGVCPFAVTEFDLLRHTPKPPHTEDHVFEPTSVRFVRTATDRERRPTLARSSFDNVAAIFEQPIRRGPGYYVMDGTGPRSIGTMRPQAIHEVTFAAGEDGVWDYRLGFYDKQDVYYRLKIVDLTWHYYCDTQRGEDRQPAQIASGLTKMLKSKTVYLRIGLARGWREFPERCFLQITAVHTSPDYLQGKTFVDFSA